MLIYLGAMLGLFVAELIVWAWQESQLSAFDPTSERATYENAEMRARRNASTSTH
jgi:hypothetical protein